MKKRPVSRQVRGDASDFLGASHILVEKVWGGRSLARLFGIKLPRGKRIGECWIFCGDVVVKLIDVRKPLSVQVHPKGDKGKSELWYIIVAGEKARVLGGIDLKEYKIKKGDWVYLPGGTVHTVLPPAVLCEVSQNNLTTYRLYDWGRGTSPTLARKGGARPLDIEKGIKEIKINFKPRIYRNINSFKCPYFRVKLEKNRGLRVGGRSFILKGSLVSGISYALTKSLVFSVSWIAKSSKTRLSGIA